MLAVFLQRPGRVLSRDQLREAVAGRGIESYDRSIDMLVGRLRRKIEVAAALGMVAIQPRWSRGVIVDAGKASVDTPNTAYRAKSARRSSAASASSLI
jgi:DNA-binding response OmpR family regulator